MKPLLTALLSTSLAAADWSLEVEYDNGKIYEKNGLTNSGCTVLPYKGHWAIWFKYEENLYTDTVCFWNGDNCDGSTEWCYSAGDSGTIDPHDFRSYELF